MHYTAPTNDDADFDPFVNDYTSPSNDTVDIQAIGSLSPPSNVHFDDTTTEDQLTLDWDPADNAAGYYVYRAQSSGSVKSDYTKIADVTSGTTFTDTSLEDGERYYYRVSSHD